MKRSEIPRLELRQAIQTKYLSPTNTRGARIVAKAYAGRKIYDWDHALNTEQNHYVAALMFAQSKDWHKQKGFKLHGGSLTDSYVWTTNV